jgi:hypothetical protein
MGKPEVAKNTLELIGNTPLIQLQKARTVLLFLPKLNS